MVSGKFDVPDAALSPVFVVFSMVSLGLIDSTYFGIDFSAPVLTFAASNGQTTVISLAVVGSLAVLGYAYYTNSRSVSDMQRVEIWILIATVGLILAPPFLPILQETLAATPAAFAALLVQSGGYYSLSFTG